MLIVSFFNPAAGLAGLISVVLAITIVTLLKYDRESTRMGFYSFNALLSGIGLGTFFEFNASFFIWLIVIGLTATVLSVTLATWLGAKGFPVLSLPFVITFWLLLLSANSLYHMGLAQRDSAIMNEMFAAGTHHAYHLPGILSFISIPAICGLFFSALSAVLFQNNILSGIIISIGLFIHSRIHFSLLVLVFIAAVLFNDLTATYQEGISYYHLGSNIMMASGAIGSFFLVPSWRSYLWALIVIPVTFVLINALTKLCGVYDLPVLSLPFVITTLLFLWFFKLRINSQKLPLTPLQYYSPEKNLYQFTNGRERLQNLQYTSLSLPFLGTWTVSQGYDGDITHKAEWGKALDFVIRDDDGHTYKYSGTRPEHFYCFNKPILACADGVVEEMVSHIDDNEIGQVNTTENWGNSLVIKHAPGIYSKVSHLKKNSIKVKVGDFVTQGTILAMCGNSGRSPEPHLHFQVQATSYIGSKTIAYPFAYFIDETGDKNKLRAFKVPREGTVLSAVEVSISFKEAFKFQPGYTATIADDNGHIENLEVFTDALNQSYFYCAATGATAYFVNNGTSFYFTAFYGSQRSLLYYFYLAAYKVFFVIGDAMPITDLYPIQLWTDRLTLWLQDLFAPFKQFLKLRFRSYSIASGQTILVNSIQYKEGFGKSKQTMAATLELANGAIKNLSVNINNKTINAQWMPGNI